MVIVPRSYVRACEESWENRASIFHLWSDWLFIRSCQDAGVPFVRIMEALHANV